jgi:hypothetical protein
LLHVYGVYGKTKNIAYVWCGREKNALGTHIYGAEEGKDAWKQKKNSSWDKNPHLLVSSDVMSYHVGYMCN